MKSVVEFFSVVKDPRCVSGCGRRGRPLRHPLHEILSVVLLGYAMGFRHLSHAHLWATQNVAALRPFCGFPNGVPSYDVITKVMRQLPPESLDPLLVRTAAADELAGALHLACDGKVLRGTAEPGRDVPAVASLTAFACGTRRTLAQVFHAAQKESEAAQMKNLLGKLGEEVLRGADVTADAAHCSRSTAALLDEFGASYVLPVKKNQKDMHADITATFGEAAASAAALAALPPGHALPAKPAVAVDAATADERKRRHGRAEVRTASVISDEGIIGHMRKALKWPSLAAIGVIERTRQQKGKESKTIVQPFVMNAVRPAEELLRVSRGHWGCENHLHWDLDVRLGEDGSQLRRGFAGVNAATMRRCALNVFDRVLATCKDTLSRPLRTLAILLDPAPFVAECMSTMLRA
jgi:predicted transposase YbfD/YdcC